MANKAKNAFLAKQEEKRIERETLVLSWGIQIVFDALTMVLNDPEVMGKDVFGERRLTKLNKALNGVAKETMQGLIKNNPAASHIRRVVDDRLRQICKSSFEPWPERYLDWDDRGI